MRRRRNLAMVVAVALGVLPLMACGSDRGGISTAPTSAPAVAAPAGASSGMFRPEHDGGSETQGVDGEGVITAVTAGTSCPTLSFSIRTVKVSVSAATIFERGACADLRVGALVEVRGMMTGDTIAATKVELKTEATGIVEIEGAITALTAGTSCPALSFSMGTHVIDVTAATTFEDGACANLHVGAMVEVKGTMTAAGHVSATRVEIRMVPAPVPAPGPVPQQPAEGEGVITALTAGTSCPALSFSIGTRKISVTAATIFEHGVCADLTVGTRVEIKGTATGDQINAARVEIKSGNEDVEGEGRVTRLVEGTSCPALKFMSDEWTVTLSASTTFVNGACSDVVAGRRLDARGTRTGEHQVMATQVIFR